MDRGIPKLSDAVTVVTGGTSGIGAAVAVELGRRAGSVLVAGRSEARLAKVTARIEEAGGRAAGITADLADPASAEAILEAALSAFGRLDHIVHAAGVYERETLEEVTVASFDAQFATNVRAPYFLTKAAVEHLHAGSAIIFTSSIYARAGALEASVYSATKAAMEGMSCALGAELASRGMRVNALVPGVVLTAMTEPLYEDPETRAALASGSMCNRWADPEEIATGVAFLLSADASFMYGSRLVLDGGWLAK